jgi:hypothetical protein
MKNQLAITLLGLAAFGSGCASPAVDDAESAPPHVDQIAAYDQALLSRPGFGQVAWEELLPPPGSGATQPPENTIAALSQKLPELAGTGVALVLHWRAANLNDTARINLVKKARAQGTPVHPWLTLEEGTAAQNEPGHADYAKTGYFPNDTNYAAWIAKAKELMTLWANNGLGTTTFVVDLEMRKPRLHQFAAMTANGTAPQTIANWLKAGINRPRHTSSIAAFKAFVDYAHARNHKVAASTLLPMIDDYGDDDDDLRQAFTVPLENDTSSAAAIQWDEISMQVQRTLYAESYPLVTSYFVQDYALLARILFGNKAGVGLGLTHGGISDTAPLYTNGEQLRLDVQAARYAGIPREKVGVYSFYGMYRRTPLSQWFAPQQSVYWPVFPDPQTGLLHASVFVLDGLMDGS